MFSKTKAFSGGLGILARQAALMEDFFDIDLSPCDLEVIEDSQDSAAVKSAEADSQDAPAWKSIIEGSAAVKLPEAENSAAVKLPEAENSAAKKLEDSLANNRAREQTTSRGAETSTRSSSTSNRKNHVRWSNLISRRLLLD